MILPLAFDSFGVSQPLPGGVELRLGNVYSADDVAHRALRMAIQVVHDKLADDFSIVATVPTSRRVRHSPGVTEPDVVPLTMKAHGLNSSGYEEIHVLVVPYTSPSMTDVGGGSIPEIEIRSWAEPVGEYVADVPLATFTAPGAGEPYHFSFKAGGRRLFLRQLTPLPGTETVGIFVSGYSPEGG